MPEFFTEDLKRVVSESYRVLKPGGKIELESQSLAFSGRYKELDEILRNAGFKQVSNGKGIK